MVNKLKTLLNQGVVNFTFKKANGEIRTARGTRNFDVLINLPDSGFTEKDKPKGTGYENPNVIPYWDLDKQAWRSVREDSIMSIETTRSDKKAVISLSGGLDSTMLLMRLLAQGYEVKAYSFNYGQKHTVELEKVQNNILFLQEMGFILTHQIIDLRDCFSDSVSSLHENGGDIPKGDYNIDNQSSTVIENRNIIFSSIIYGKALSWAKRTNSNVVIALGIHAGDHSVYPDTTKESFEAAAHCFKISNWDSDKVEYIAPFVENTKAEVLAEGIAAMTEMNFYEDEMEHILINTHSCYDPGENGESCGKCGTCKERLEAFEENSIVDPIKYMV